MHFKVNDGSYHVLRFTRNGANTTLQIDDFPLQRTISEGKQLLVFNTQRTIEMGGKWNRGLQRIERPFIGVMAGLGMVSNNISIKPIFGQKIFKAKMYHRIGFFFSRKNFNGLSFASYHITLKWVV